MLRGVGLLSNIGGQTSAALIAVTNIIVVIEVLMRYAFNKPLRWGLDVTLALMIAFSLLATGYVQQRKTHITFGLVVEHLPRRAKRIVAIISTAISAILCGIIAWQGVPLTSASLALHEKSGQQILPWAPFKAMVIVGFGLWCLMFIKEFIELVSSKSSANNEGGDTRGLKA